MSKSPKTPHRGDVPDQSAVRVADWKARLITYLAWSAAQSFDYGQFDCASFVFGAVEAMTGTDPGATYRGRYKSLREGVALVRKNGFRDHVDLTRHYFPEVPVAFAQAGDIAVVAGDDGPALGLVQGEYIYALVPTGMKLVPLLSAERAFRVT